MALGAPTGSVLWLVTAEMLLGLVGLGVLVGVPLSYLAGTALRSQLYGVGAHDPVAIVASVAVLAVVGLLASALPAHRAATIDPRIALNAD